MFLRICILKKNSNYKIYLFADFLWFSTKTIHVTVFIIFVQYENFEERKKLTE